MYFELIQVHTEVPPEIFLSPLVITVAMAFIVFIEFLLFNFELQIYNLFLDITN